MTRALSWREYRVSADTLRYAMRKAGYDKHGGLAALARDSGLKPATIGAWLSGAVKDPQVSAVKQVANALDIDMELLLEEEDW